MDCKERLAEYAAWTQQGLEEYLAPQPGLLGRVMESARYSALAGGKRLRPALLMEFYRLCG